MSKMTDLTLEEKVEIENLFREGKKNTYIAAAVGRAPQTIANYLDRVGLKPIKHYTDTTAANKSKACPKCRATGHLKGSRFCYRCGADIRGEETILREKVQRILRDIQLMPESARNEASDTLQAVMKYLEKQGA